MSDERVQSEAGLDRYDYQKSLAVACIGFIIVMFVVAMIAGLVYGSAYLFIGLAYTACIVAVLSLIVGHFVIQVLTPDPFKQAMEGRHNA